MQPARRSITEGNTVGEEDNELNVRHAKSR
jgi:hypothetical protein